MAKNSKKQDPEIVICQYAGDPEDEYCSTCSGVTMEIEGAVFPCTECQSYTPQEAKPQDTPPQNNETPRDEVETPKADTYTPQGLTTCIKAESGLSIETKQGWYRFSYTEERIVPETADIEKEKQALWDAVNSEVDKQAEDVKLMLAAK